MVVCPIVNIIQASKMTYLHSWVTCASYAVTSTSCLFQQRNVKYCTSFTVECITEVPIHCFDSLNCFLSLQTQRQFDMSWIQYELKQPVSVDSEEPSELLFFQDLKKCPEELLPCISQ